MDNLKEGNYNEVISSATQDIADIIIGDLDFDTSDDYESSYFNSLYDDIFEHVESFISGNSNMNWLNEYSEDYGDEIFNILTKAKELLQENKIMKKEELFNKIYSLNEDFSTRRDYNVKYQKKAEFTLEDIPHKIGQTNIKPAVKSKPGNFKYNDGGWGPIPTTGVGKRDYEAKYSRTGSLTEGYKGNIYPCPYCDEKGEFDESEGTCTNPHCTVNTGDYCFKCMNDWRDCTCDNDEFLDESMPIHTKSGKLIEKRVPPKGVISPALKESIKDFEEKKRLIENKIVDKSLAHLLEWNDELEDEAREQASFEASEEAANRIGKDNDYEDGYSEDDEWEDETMEASMKRARVESGEEDWDEDDEDDDNYDGPGFNLENYISIAENAAAAIGGGITDDDILNIISECFEEGAETDEDFVEAICDRYQLDMEQGDNVADAFNISGKRNRDYPETDYRTWDDDDERGIDEFTDEEYEDYGLDGKFNKDDEYKINDEDYADLNDDPFEDDED